MIASIFVSAFRPGHAAAIAVVFGLIAAAATAQTAPPVLAFMQPAAASAGDPALTLNITGTGFTTGSIVYWGAEPLPTIVVSENQISAAVRAELLGFPGQFGISVVNPNQTRSASLGFTVIGVPLSITTATLPASQAGMAYSQLLTAAGGTAPYVWTAVDALPAGLTLSQGGLLSGTPLANGSFGFTVRVTDAAQRVAARTLTLSVTAPSLLIGTPAVLPPAFEGMAYTQTLRVEIGTAPFRWSAGAGLPAGITLDASTGILSGAPAMRGNYSFSVQVTDNTGASVSKSFSLAVQTPQFVITTASPLLTGFAGSPYSQTFSAQGGTQPYSWTARQQVPGLAFDRLTGVLAGTPEQAGTFTLTVQVTDKAGITASKEFALMIGQPQLLITNSSSLPPADIGTAYRQQLLATGGKPPYTWSIASGSALGLALDASTGILSFTPTAAGTFTVSVTVRDSDSATSTRSFSVSAIPGPLRLTAQPDTLQNGAGKPFSVALAAAGGTPPYTWSASGLPEGLRIDSGSGIVSGTFPATGTFLFTVSVRDSVMATATELVTVDVVAPALPQITAVNLPEMTDAAKQISMQLQLSAPYTLPLSGQLILDFAPETGSGDPAIQFSTGGRTMDFQIPAGAVQLQFPSPSAGFQTGTVAGTITLSARFQTQGVTLTPKPVIIQPVRVNQSVPVITSATFSRVGSTIEVRITGFSTSREITQGVFRFRASGGNTLSTGEVSIPLEDTFGRWFRDSGSAQYGGQFTFTQQFAIQGDVNAVTPVSVTLSNQAGSTGADIRE